ncbi:hypothetical protein OKW21_002022 [Catalinimonas alkaloidigena]|uniref:hypothetical protein n=1 Tax=Catalinimonas alkaloidigena TaxID=1075417 RepID=UPI002405D3EB|nr:hypothetical protein [Catalinimonas alkaloidigena]MDF9796759.1 hypothetical protein [Catalinimonas alkaloidigena]
MSLTTKHNKTVSLNINPASIIKIELIIVAALLLLNLLQQFLLYEGIQPKIITFIDLNEENNFPSLFSGINLMFTGCVVLLISLAKDRGSRFYKHWFFISFVFFFLGADELASIHERVGRYTSIFLGVEDTIGGFIWVLPFSILLLILAYFYLPFLLHLPALYKKLLVIASIVFVGGGMVMESIGSTMVGVSVYYPLEYIVEETLEMLGVIIFLYAFFKYLKNEIGEINLSFLFRQVE